MSLTPSAEAGRQTLSELVAKILDQLSVSAWLPAGVLVLIGVAVGSLRAAGGNVARAISDLGSLSLSALVLLVIGIVLATVLTQAFQFEAIRLLEGYWGPGPIRGAMTELRCRRHLGKRDRLWARLGELGAQAALDGASVMREDGIDRRIVDLVLAVDRGDVRLADLTDGDRAEVTRHPWQDYASPASLRKLDALAAAARRYPDDDHAIRPTRLGNMLRAFEDPIEAQIGRPIESFVQDVFHVLPVSLQDQHDQWRGRLDLYCSLVAVFALDGLLGVLVLSAVGWGAAIASASGALLLSWLSYRAAVTSARAYGSTLQTIADLHAESPPMSRGPLTQLALRSSFIRRFL